MLLAVDTHYRGRCAATAAVCFCRWTDATPNRTLTSKIDPVADYRPGELYKRELPPICHLLNAVTEPIEVIVIDGYVWLDSSHRPGLGAHLFQALGRRTAVVGVAKNPFHGSAHAHALCRGTSARPLYVTAAGRDPAQSARDVQSMHGAHRMPTLLKLVDRLSRAALAQMLPAR